MLEHHMADILELPDVRSRPSRSPGPVLVYLLPRQYVMQGMIADTPLLYMDVDVHNLAPLEVVGLDPGTGWRPVPTRCSSRGARAERPDSRRPRRGWNRISHQSTICYKYFRTFFVGFGYS
jgi:hypothetical protein